MDKNGKKIKVNFHHDELANDGLHKGFGDTSWTHREKDLVEFVINNFSHVNELEQLVKENDSLHSVSNRICPRCDKEMLKQDKDMCIDCWQKYVNV